MMAVTTDEYVVWRSPDVHCRIDVKTGVGTASIEFRTEGLLLIRLSFKETVESKVPRLKTTFGSPRACPSQGRGVHRWVPMWINARSIAVFWRTRIVVCVGTRESDEIAGVRNTVYADVWIGRFRWP
jgi:hypothetical protein